MRTRLAPHARPFTGFVVVGAANTAVFFGAYLLLHLVVGYLVATVLAQLLALVVAFASNAWVTFEVQATLRRALLYPLSNFGAIGLRTACVAVLVQWLHVSKVATPLVATALVMPVSYLATRAMMLGRQASVPA